MNVQLDSPEGGLNYTSAVKTSQLLTISQQRFEKRLGCINPEKLAQVNRAIGLNLDLP